MDVDSMINTLKRFYYSQVGRGNKMIFSFLTILKHLQTNNLETNLSGKWSEKWLINLKNAYKKKY